MVQRGREEIGPRPGEKGDDAAFRCPMRVRQQKCALGLIKSCCAIWRDHCRHDVGVVLLIAASPGPFLNCRTCSSGHAGWPWYRPGVASVLSGWPGHPACSSRMRSPSQRAAAWLGCFRWHRFSSALVSRVALLSACSPLSA